MILQIEKPSRYVAFGNVEIFERGILFYKAESGKEFNLPKGKYLVNGTISEIPFTRIPKTFEISNVFVNPEKQLKINFIDNYPNVCSIDPETGIVLADARFKHLPSYIFGFVLFHEIGHFRYRGQADLSEKQCDAYARERMLDEGFNPSQIDLAINLTLSNNTQLSCNRKKISFQVLKK